MGDNLLRKTLLNFFWRFFERVGAQLVAFVVSLIIARLLEPEAYGVIALVTVVTGILNVFVDSGLGTGLIQKKDANDTDFSTVFYTNIIFCLFLYSFLFLCAPLIARFYKNTDLTPVIRVLGLTIVISGTKNVLQSYVTKHLMFKKFFFATLAGTLFAAGIGIFMALKGFGVWALVAQHIVNLFIDTVILWIIVPWKPRLEFSLSSLRSLYSFGWKLLVSKLIHTLYLDIRQLVIGKVYSPSDLAYYNQGNKFPRFISSNINSSIDSVLFPVMSLEQNDVKRLKAMTRRSIMTSSYIMWPLLLGVAGTSKTLIPIILTEKWLPCVPYLIVACFEFGFEPLQTANLNAIKALGRTDISLRLEIIKKSISTAIIFITMPFGVMAIAIGSAIYAVIATVCNSLPNKKLLGYSYFEQIKDILPAFFLASAMFVLIYFIPLPNMALILRLFIQFIIGSFFYLSLSALLRVESFLYVKNLIKDNFPKFRKI